MSIRIRLSGDSGEEAFKCYLREFLAVKQDRAKRRRADPAEQGIVDCDHGEILRDFDIPVGEALQYKHRIVIGRDDDGIELPRRSRHLVTAADDGIFAARRR